MSSAAISKDKLVSFSYVIHDPAGHELERSDLPLTYVHGANSGLIERVEEALEGCSAGDTVAVTLDPEDGFGPHDPSLTYTDDLENVPHEYHRVGAEVQFENESGDVRTFVVSRIEGGKLTVDGNHPLAGKQLTFRVTVLEVRDATPAEIAAGGVGRPGIH